MVRPNKDLDRVHTFQTKKALTVFSHTFVYGSFHVKTDIVNYVTDVAALEFFFVVHYGTTKPKLVSYFLCKLLPLNEKRVYISAISVVIV